MGGNLSDLGLRWARTAARAALGAALVSLFVSANAPESHAGAPSTPPNCEITSFFDDGNTQSFFMQGTDSGGVCDADLSLDAVNLQLNWPFPKGCPSPINFSAEVLDSGQPARGNVTIWDTSESTDVCRIDLPVDHPAEPSESGWGEDIEVFAPIFVGRGEPSGGGGGGEALGLVAYLAAGRGGLQLYDVTDPGDPIFMSAHDPANFNTVCPNVSGYPRFYADGITIQQDEKSLSFETPYLPGDTAFVAMGPCGLVGWDIDDPFLITQAFHFFPPSWTEAVDTLEDAANETIYLYAAAFWGGLRIYGQTDPDGDPAEFGEIGTWGVDDETIGPVIDIFAEFRDVNPDAKIDDIRPVVFVMTDIGLFVVDVSDPTDPMEIGSFMFNPVDEEIGEGMDIVGNRAFIAAWKGGLLVLDILDPTMPVRLAPDQSIPTDLAFYNVTTDPDGLRLYAAEGSWGMRHFYITPNGLNEQAPSPIDVGGGGWAWSLFEMDRFVYVSYGHLTNPLTGGFQIFEFAPDDQCGEDFLQAMVLPVFVYWHVRRKRKRKAA